MKTIEERALKANPYRGTSPYDEYESGRCVGWDNGYIQGATEQKAIDHSEEHLNWIIKQYHIWMYHNCHTLTFKEWIDKAMEE